MAAAATPSSGLTGSPRAGGRALGRRRRPSRVAGSGWRGHAGWLGGRARARIRRLIATLARRTPRTAVAPAAAATRSIARDAGGRLRRVAAASVTEVPDGLHHRGHRPRGLLVVPEPAPRPSPPSTRATLRLKSTASHRSVPEASKPTTQ